MNSVLMKCGCKAQGVDEKGNPVCVTHIGLDNGARVVAKAPNLKGRFASCIYGNHGKVPSSLSLPFFQYRSKIKEDVYYCGCFGWD